MVLLCSRFKMLQNLWFLVFLHKSVAKALVLLGLRLKLLKHTIVVYIILWAQRVCLRHSPLENLWGTIAANLLREKPIGFRSAMLKHHLLYNPNAQKSTNKCVLWVRGDKKTNIQANSKQNKSETKNENSPYGFLRPCTSILRLLDGKHAMHASVKCTILPHDFLQRKGKIHETCMLCMFSQSSGFDMFSTIYGIMCLSREFAVMGQLAFMPRSSCTHPSSCASAQGSAPSTTPSTAIDCSMQCSFQAGSTPRFAVTPCVYSYLDLSFSQFWTKT